MFNHTLEVEESAYAPEAHKLEDITCLEIPRAVSPLHIPPLCEGGRGAARAGGVVFAGSAGGRVHVLCVLGSLESSSGGGEGGNGGSRRVVVAGCVECPLGSMGRVLLVKAVSVGMIAAVNPISRPLFSLKVSFVSIVGLF